MYIKFDYDIDLDSFNFETAPAEVLRMALIQSPVRAEIDAKAAIPIGAIYTRETLREEVPDISWVGYIRAREAFTRFHTIRPSDLKPSACEALIAHAQELYFERLSNE